MLYVVIWSMQMIAAVVVSPVLAYTLPGAGFTAASFSARCASPGKSSFPALTASTMAGATSIPMTSWPLSAYWTARGSPIFPRATTAMRIRLLSSGRFPATSYVTGKSQERHRDAHAAEAVGNRGFRMRP